MLTGALVLAVLCAGGGLWLAQLRFAQDHDIRELSRDIAAAAARYTEAQRMLMQRRRIGAVQQLAETAVDGTTRTVQGLHRGIASIPFEILERIPETRATTRIVREVHDVTSDTVYGGIRGINRLLGKGLRRGIRADSSHDNGDEQ
ncbi:hypothetical protein [Algiphilus sp.]|uniref:hypothetical protein n=1 Tax=Algiphilus sp. TaxID=1872431 RepID=UPI003B523A0E